MYVHCKRNQQGKVNNAAVNLIGYAVKLFRKKIQMGIKIGQIERNITRCALIKGQIMHIDSPLVSGPKPM